MELSEGGVSIRPVESGDVQILWDILSVPEIAYCLSADPMSISFDTFLTFLAQSEPGTSSRVFAITSNNCTVGVVTINNISQVKNSAYMGTLVVAPGTPKNTGTTAFRLAIGYCFKTLCLHRLYGHVWSNNVKGLRVYKKIGCTHEGTLREHTRINGKYVDLEIFGMLRKEWHGSSN